MGTPLAGDSISVDDKRQALGRVLAGRTFSRSERLRAFLRYVCEAEFEGRPIVRSTGTAGQITVSAPSSGVTEGSLGVMAR